MTTIRWILTVFCISFFIPANAQINEWSFGGYLPSDTVIRKIMPFGFVKYKSGIYDTMQWGWNLSDSVAVYKQRQAELKYRHDEPTDTVCLVVKKRQLLPGDSIFFRIQDNGRLIQDWKRINFSPENILLDSFYKLADLPRFGHNYKISYALNKTTNSDSYAYSMRDMRPTPVLVGVFFKEQEDSLSDALIRISKHKTSDVFQDMLPHVDWNKYQPDARFDSVMRINWDKYWSKHQPGSHFDPIAHIDSSKGYIDMKLYPSDYAHYVPVNHRQAGLYVYSTHNTILFLYNAIGDSTALEYQLTPESMEADTLKTWQHTLPGSYLIRLSDLAPGEYRLKVRYNRFNSKINSYGIIIRPLWYQAPWVSWIRGFLLGLSIVLVPFFIFKRTQKAKLRRKEKERTMLDLEIKSYRSQLNPHFIFNALSAIQGLINKQDSEGANRYLASFSQLLRKTLDEQVAAFWTLQDELDLLEQYIELEQLRFGIQYVVQIDERISSAQVSFPSMLLQPVVENAVRHGISGMAGNGKIMIMISGTNDLFTISVTDNGRGFDINTVTTGNHGLRLTNERIALYNSHSNGHIRFDIVSEPGNTTASFYFEHL